MTLDAFVYVSQSVKTLAMLSLPGVEVWRMRSLQKPRCSHIARSLAVLLQRQQTDGTSEEDKFMSPVNPILSERVE